MDADPEAKIIRAFEKATRTYLLCPNRVWAISGSLPGKEKSLPLLFPPQDEKVERLFANTGDGNSNESEKHDTCTFKFCERSQMNFTSVAQRHEPRSCEGQQCHPISDRFDRAELDTAVQMGDSTAWHLNGRSTVAAHHRFMAISHVWSDGTGTGARAEGQVNKCLYGFFASIARQFGCHGLWWDTICIPREKTARAKAISSMHENYENAKVTLIHDCFLRNLEWIDAETACLAIAMSPWFSRGWTALELAKSRNVKVLFKQQDGLVLKDLDRDILNLKSPLSERHRILADAIRQLRDEDITDLDRLLTVLGPRHSSWSRDFAIIAGLLVGVSVEAAAGSTKDVFQQDIYQRILRKISILRHGHLFHNSPTISNGASWCPTSLFDLPLAPAAALSDSFLQVESNGDVEGMWNMISLERIPDEYYIWNDVHPLIKAKLRSALRHMDDHYFLVEPDLAIMDKALLVRKRFGGAFQFIGCMYFHPPQKIQAPRQLNMIIIASNERLEQTQVDDDLAHHLNDAVDTEKGDRKETTTSIPVDQRSLKVADLAKIGDGDRVVGSQQRRFNKLEDMERVEQRPAVCTQISSQQIDTKQSLLWAAEEGNSEVVDSILQQLEESMIIEGKLGTRDSPANAHQREILDFQSDQGMTPLSLAAQHGYEKIVAKLLLWIEVDINFTCRPADMSKMPMLPHGKSPHKLATPLLLAAENGHTKVVKRLLDAGAAFWGVKNTELPLSAAAAGGHVAAVKLLLQAGAQVNAGWTYNNRIPGYPLMLAAENGHDNVVELLLRNGATVDKSESTDNAKLVGAVLEKGHLSIAELLLSAKDCPDGPWRNYELQKASSGGQFRVVELLLRHGADVNASDMGGMSDGNGYYRDSYGNALHAAATKNWTDDEWQGPALPWEAAEPSRRLVRGHSLKTVEVLLRNGADVNAQGGEYGTALQAASAVGNTGIVNLLMNYGADVNAKGGTHGTALKAAKHFGHTEVVKLLQGKGAKKSFFT